MNLLTHRQHLLELSQLNQKKWNILKIHWKDEKALEFDRIYLKNFRRQLALSMEALDEMELIFNQFKEEYEQ